MNTSCNNTNVSSHTINSARQATTRVFSPPNRFGFQDQYFPSTNINQGEQRILRPINYQGRQSTISSYQPIQKENKISLRCSQDISDHKDINNFHRLQCENDRINSSLIGKNLELERINRRYEVLVLERNQLEEQLGYYKNVSNQTENVYYGEFQQARQQCEHWKHRCQELELRVREASSGSQEQIREVNAKLAVLSTEVERQNQINNQKNVENENLSQQLRQLIVHENESKNKDNKIMQYDREINYLKTQLLTRNEKLNSQLLLKDNQINILMDKCMLLEEQKKVIETKIGYDQTTDQNRHNKFGMQQMVVKNTYEQDGLQAEIERLNKDLENKNKQIKEGQNSHRDTGSTHEMDRLHQQINQLKEVRKNDSQELDRVKIILRSLELRIKEYEHRILQAQTENIRISALLKLNSEEHDRMKEMIESEIFSEVDTWKRKFCELNRDYHQLQEHNWMVGAELEAKKSKKHAHTEATLKYETYQNTILAPSHVQGFN